MSALFGIDVATEFVGRACAPLVANMGTNERVTAFVADLGWNMPSVPSVFGNMYSSAFALSGPLGDLTVARRNNDDAGAATATAAIASAFGALVTTIESIPTSLGQELPSTFLAATGIQNALQKRLVDSLVIDAIAEFQAARSVLLVLGLLEETDLPANASTFQPAFTLRELRTDRLTAFLSNPSSVLKDVYGWGTPTIDEAQLQVVLHLLSFALLSSSESVLPSTSLLQAMFPTIQTSGTVGEMTNIPIGLYNTVPLEVAVFPAPKATTTENQGLAFRLLGMPQGSVTLPLPSNLQVAFTATAALDSGIGFVVYPDQPMKVVGNLAGTASALTSGAVGLALSNVPGPSPISLFDIGGGSGLSATGFHLDLGLQTSPPDVALAVGIDGGKLVISLAGADGFIGTTVPSSAIAVDFDLEIGWSNARGVFFSGSGGIKAELPLHVRIGPVTIDTLDLALELETDGVTLAAGATIGVVLGPVQAIVQGMGLAAKLAFKTGNMGPMDLGAATFVPPTGLGVTIDAGPVAGGGFLSFDSQGGRYSGAVELQIYSIAVKAFGLVDTKLLDGSKGFSFVVVISAEFTPIQLGLGFTLIGVGGLVGINRSLNSKGLSNAVRAGSLEHVLFPRNPVQDAPAIINDLATIFPASKSHYVFGPMAKLGWGTPTLINAELGIVLELPGPRLALLGVVQAALPSSQVPLLSIHLAVQGSLDFPKRLLSFDASLYDSHVNGFNLSGDTSLRLSWGDNPNFAFAMGGFNPVYQPPPGFPTLKRISVDVGINGNPRLTAQGYFALTSNTAQVGAALDLHASGSGIDLDGHLGFDALFVFSPFSFEADFSAGVSVSFHGAGLGINLHGSISGPSPFHVDAQACVSVFIWDACLPISVTFGSNKRADLPPLDPFAGNPPPASPVVIGLSTAVGDSNNWSGSFPKGVHPVVTLSAQASGGQPTIDPVGQASLHQKVCPLNFKLSRFGAYKPKTHTIFTLNNPTVHDGTTPAPTPIPVVTRDKFAPALFKDMSGAEKLSSKPYDLFDAGFTIDPDNVVYDTNIQSHVVKYDTEVVDNQSNVTTAKGDFALTLRHLLGMLTRSAPALGGIRRTGTERFVDPTATVLVVLGEETFVVADGCSLATASSITGSAVQQTLAQIALDAHLASQPSDRGEYRVVPAYLAA